MNVPDVVYVLRNRIHFDGKNDRQKKRRQLKLNYIFAPILLENSFFTLPFSKKSVKCCGFKNSAKWYVVCLFSPKSLLMLLIVFEKPLVLFGNIKQFDFWSIKFFINSCYLFITSRHCWTRCQTLISSCSCFAKGCSA